MIICPITGDKVLYLECTECEDKHECKNRKANGKRKDTLSFNTGHIINNSVRNLDNDGSYIQ